MSTGRVLLSWETLFDSSKAWIVWMRSIHRPGPGSRLRECRQGGRDGPSRSRRWRATRPAPSGRTRSRSAMVTRAPPERTNSAERSTISPLITLTTTSTSPTSSNRSRCRSRESPGAARRASPTRIVASARSRGPRGSASCIPGARDFPAGQDARADDGANRTGVERVSHACGVDDSAGDEEPDLQCGAKRVEQLERRSRRADVATGLNPLRDGRIRARARGSGRLRLID